MTYGSLRENHTNMTAVRVCTVKTVYRKTMQCEYILIITHVPSYPHPKFSPLSQIDDGKVLDLKCPNPTCAKELTEEVMSAVVCYYLPFSVVPFYLLLMFST